jgi:hypothetical protein
MMNKLLALLIGITIVTITQPSQAQINSISNLPKISVKTKVFDMPWSRPMIIIDDFLGQGKLVVADASIDANFLGIAKKGLISVWSIKGISFAYCLKDYPNENCVNLNGREAFVKVDGKVFMLEIDRVGQKNPYRITPELREAILKTSQPVWVRVGTISDREIGRQTITSLQEIAGYVQSNPCAEENALCSSQSVERK